MSPPYPPARCCRTTPIIAIPPGGRYLSPSSRHRRLDQCSPFAMICWTLPCRAFIFPFSSFALCCYLDPCLPPFISTRFIPSLHYFTSFPQCFPYTFRSLPPPASHLYRFSICVTHSPLLSLAEYKNLSRYQVVVCVFLGALVCIVPRIVSSFVCKCSHGPYGAVPYLADGISYARKREINIILQ